jgi:peptidoglycan/LPS O-acetylase OafA/YrhL
MAARDRSLDGIRGIAALWVVAAHASYQSLLPPIVNFKGAGRGGVVIFFFLSAFLISGPFLNRQRTSLHWRSWLAYWIRRLCRIVPLYFLVLFAAFYFHLNPFNGSPPSSVFLKHLFFQEGWSVFWTIVVEMRFYFVLPFLLIPMAWVLQTTKHGRLFLGLAILTWLACVNFGVIHHGFMRTLGIDKHAPVFISGMLTALVLTGPSFHSETSDLRVANECLAWLSMLAILVLSIPAIYFWITKGTAISAYVATSPEYEAFWDARIPWIGLTFGIFFFSISDGKSLLARALASTPLAWAGKVSFGIYLLHLDVFESFEKFQRPGATRLLLALAACFALAYVLHRTVEGPTIDLGKRLSKKIAKR